MDRSSRDGALVERPLHQVAHAYQLRRSVDSDLSQFMRKVKSSNGQKGIHYFRFLGYNVLKPDVLSGLKQDFIVM